jgi:hypothetical protein
MWRGSRRAASTPKAPIFSTIAYRSRLDNSLVWRLVFVTGGEQEPCRLGEVEDN